MGLVSVIDLLGVFSRILVETVSSLSEDWLFVQFECTSGELKVFVYALYFSFAFMKSFTASHTDKHDKDLPFTLFWPILGPYTGSVARKNIKC